MNSCSGSNLFIVADFQKNYFLARSMQVWAVLSTIKYTNPLFICKSQIFWTWNSKLSIWWKISVFVLQPIVHIRHERIQTLSFHTRGAINGRLNIISMISIEKFRISMQWSTSVKSGYIETFRNYDSDIFVSLKRTAIFSSQIAKTQLPKRIVSFLKIIKM